MSSTRPAENGPEEAAPASAATPFGVRTHAVITGRWIALALAGAAGLTALMFFFLPAWLAPARNQAPPPAATASAPAHNQARMADPAESARQRLLATEAEARYRDKRASLEQQGAPAWASEPWASASRLGDSAAAAANARDYARAIALYDDATRRLGEIAGQTTAAFERALAAGNAALAARASAEAAKAFQLALAIRPGDKNAGRGLGRAKHLDEVLARFTAGESHEKAGALTQARQEYAAAVSLDPEFAPAQAALARLDGRRAAERFDGLMTRGLEQLERSDWPGAEQTFSAALAMRPGHPAATDGLARAKQAQQRQSLAQLQRDAQGFESAERWEDALAAYRRAAAIDPAIDFAREGIARGNRMIALHARIAAYLAAPERLYATAVRAEAQQFLAALDSEPAPGPRLRQERQRLAAAVKRASTPVNVQLASDNATEVTLYQVGQLGRFATRQVSLTPGTYTLVGSRAGYKDVRVQLIVTPDASAPRVFIACEERV